MPFYFPRPHHLVKNILVLPGSLLAYSLDVGSDFSFLSIFLAFLSCSLISAWNYALNDHLDRKEDAWHPEKSDRIQTDVKLSPKIRLIFTGVFLLGCALCIALWVEFNTGLTTFLILLLLSGVVYNVRPFRLKRFPFIDVVVEALNFPIRLAIGWYALAPSDTLPPLSAMLSIWGLGGVLLTGKRSAELARIGNLTTARAYRPALLHYSKERALVMSSLYGMVMLFGSGILFAVYSRLHNLIFLLPLILLLMGIYLWKLADGEINTRELEPEELLKRRSIWIAILVLSLLATVLILLPVDLAEKLHFFGQ